MTTDSSISDAIAMRTHSGPIHRLVSAQIFWVLLAAVIASVVLGVVTDTFATERNLFNVTRNFAFVGIIAIGMTAVIITRNIDLSVGSTVVVSAMVTGVTMSSGLSIELAFLLAIGAALIIGLVNGALISILGMPSFVVTLGMLSIARSLAMVLSDNRMIYEFGPDGATLLAIGGGSLFGVPNPVYFLVILALVTGFAFRWTQWGRYLYAIGGNEHAAIVTGVPVTMVKISVFMFSAFCAGITGFLEVGWLGGVTTNLGQAMELTVIAAAVIGGANLAGGAGTALGAVVGAALIEVIRNSLILLGISTFWQGTFVGSFIIVAVAFERFRRLNTAN